MNELGRLLENIARIVPAGVVCFFPSYDYEEQIFNHLNSSGTIDKIKNYKKVKSIEYEYVDNITFLIRLSIYRNK